MPAAPDDRPEAVRRLDRRAVLAAAGTVAALAALAGCTGSSTPAPSPTPTPTLTPDQLARQAAAAREQDLHGLAATALEAFPTLPGAHRTLAFTAEHVLALEETLVPSAAPARTGSAGSTGSTGSAVASRPAGSASSSTPRPGTRTATARALAAALLVAADGHRKAAAATSGELARLLVSVAASDSALAAELRGIGR